MTADQNEGMRTMADLVLEPGAYWDRQNQFAPTSIPAVDAVNTAWQQYRTGTPPAVQYTRSGRVEDYTVDIAPPPYAPASLNYPDAYYPAITPTTSGTLSSRSSAPSPTRLRAPPRSRMTTLCTAGT